MVYDDNDYDDHNMHKMMWYLRVKNWGTTTSGMVETNVIDEVFLVEGGTLI